MKARKKCNAKCPRERFKFRCGPTTDTRFPDLKVQTSGVPSLFLSFFNMECFTNMCVILA